MPDARPLAGDDPRRLGEYRLLGRLGAGGQGVVYLGQGPDGRHVAVKRLRAGLIANPTARGRFAREVTSARRVAPFCTAEIVAADIEGEYPYVVSEYIDGPSLSEAVRGDGPCAEDVLNRLAVGTMTALTAIHQAGIVHRDFKPANVLLSADGPKVIDFGIARALEVSARVTSGVIGTPAFMAPEQVRAENAGTQADVFAWGATMVFAATGRSPFGADSVPATLARVTNVDPDLSALPDHLRPIVAACLAKDPARRPAARDVLLRLLQAVAPAGPSPLFAQANQVSLLVPPPPGPLQPAPPAPTQGRRWPGHPAYAAALGAAITAVVLGAAGFGWAVLSGRLGTDRPTSGVTRSPASSSPVSTGAASPGTQGGDQKAIPVGFAGAWRGVAFEENTGRRWTVRISLTAGRDTGQFALPSLECSGTAEVTRATDARIELRQRPNQSKDPRCTGRLAIDGSTAGAELRWVEPAKGAVAYLRREPEEPRVPGELSGTWATRLRPHEAIGNKPMRPRDVKITLRKGATGIVGTLEYPELGCRGVLAIISGLSSRSNADVRVLEDFSRAPERCRRHSGDFNISQFRDEAPDIYYHPPEGGSPIGKAKLRRG